MRIAVNTRLLLADRLEGVGYFTQEVARRLVERRPEDEFIFLFDRPFDPRFVFADNVTPVVVHPPARHPLLWYAWFEGALPGALRRCGAEVLLSPDGYLSLRSPVPTVLVAHDLAYLHYPRQVPPLVRRYYGYFVPRYLHRADQIITVSDYVKQDILAHYRLAPERISVACNGVKEEFRPLDEAEKTAVRAEFAGGREYFFYVGSIHPRKNLPRLLGAYARYRSGGGRPVKLLIGGRFAWQTGEVAAAHAANPYREDIEFLGYVPADQLARLLGAARALTYVSLFEGFGVPLLEAMQAEVPIVTANVTSLPEVAGPAALLVDPTSEEAIAAALLRLDREPGLAEQLVAAGRAQRDKFSWERATDVVEAALERKEK
ncbi:MAG: glycosyltransferase family 1 protein [Saprospiraceae bacterium]